MNLETGSQLGNYTIVGHLGAGGMGEVYRATDSSLGRDVAIKVLPAAMVDDPERLARFEREAKLLAALNHPQIAAIYGLEEAEGQPYLVLELVEGGTLAEVLAKGAMAPLDALEIARQIALAVESAHERGIVHRDLKPNNIKITPDGQVKVLDFGLAKALVDDGAESSGGEAETVTAEFTHAGAILGTAAYMSPEQARGLPVDARTDIWAFGCVLYACLEGDSPFRGPTVTDSIAATLHKEPEWERLPATAPRGLRKLLERCLAKEPRQRLHHMADVRLELEALADTADDEVPIATGQAGRPAYLWMGIASAALLIALVAVADRFGQPTAVAPPARPKRALALFLEGSRGEETSGEESLGSIRLSPDGEHLVYLDSSAGTPQLLMANLREAETKVLLDAPGTQPFFSPDGKRIGFDNSGKLQTLRLQGGHAETLWDVPSFYGGAWAPNDTIYFVPSISAGVWSIPASGGEAKQITRPNTAKGEFAHWWPQLTPDGSTLLFTNWRTSLRDSQVVAWSLSTGEQSVLCERASAPNCTSNGFLTYARSGTLMAVRMDLERLEVRPPHIALVDDLYHSLTDGDASYSFSREGLLLYLRGAGPKAQRRIVWVDRDGKITAVGMAAAAYVSISLSPTGNKLAFDYIAADIAKIGVHDLVRGETIHLPTDAFSSAPIFVGPEKVAYTCFPDGPFDIYLAPADFSEPGVPLVDGELDQILMHASQDGSQLFYMQVDPETGSDLWSVSTDDDSALAPGKPVERKVVANQRYAESGIVLSPDEQFFAYASNHTGRNEIYVRRISGGAPRQVSRNGGLEPRWATDGRELYFRSTNSLMAVTFQADQDTVQLGLPQTLFNVQRFYQSASRHTYAVGTDGRFLFVEDQAPPRVMVVVNGLDELTASPQP